MPTALSSTTQRRMPRARSSVSWTGPCGAAPVHCVADAEGPVTSSPSTPDHGQEALASGPASPGDPASRSVRFFCSCLAAEAYMSTYS